MTDTSKKSGGRPWTLNVTPTTGFNEGTGSNDNPYMHFRGDIETSRGVKNRSISVFNTQRFPNLIEDVKTALVDGTAKFTLRFDYDQGETAKILGVGYVDFRKSAGGTPTDGAPAEPVAAELPLETPVDETPVVETPVEEPVAQADPMEGVVVEMKKPRRRRKAA